MGVYFAVSPQPPSSPQIAGGWHFSPPEYPLQLSQHRSRPDVDISWPSGHEAQPPGLERRPIRLCVEPTSLHLTAIE